MKLVVVEVGGRDGGLVVEAGAMDELDGNRRREEKTGNLGRFYFQGPFALVKKVSKRQRQARPCCDLIGKVLSTTPNHSSSIVQ